MESCRELCLFGRCGVEDPWCPPHLWVVNGTLQSAGTLSRLRECHTVVRKSLHWSTSHADSTTLLFDGVLHYSDCMLLEHALAHICYRSIASRRSSHFWWGGFSALGRDMNCRWLGKLSTSKLNLTVQTKAALALFGSVRVLVVLAAASLLDLHFLDVPHATRTLSTMGSSYRVSLPRPKVSSTCARSHLHEVETKQS